MNINKQIKELEREMPDTTNFDSGIHKGHWTKDDIDFVVSEAKLQTLQECKKMFEDYNQKLKEELTGNNEDEFTPSGDVDIRKKIDNLSKEVMGE